jgi:hypothetical protein
MSLKNTGELAGQIAREQVLNARLVGDVGLRLEVRIALGARRRPRCRGFSNT